MSPISVFQPAVIELDDLGAKHKVDVARQTLMDTEQPADLKMHSESLWFLFKNTFGFDTLLVNGCLEETSNGEFSKAARSLSVENLNNLGIRFDPGIFLETKILGFFLNAWFKYPSACGALLNKAFLAGTGRFAILSERGVSRLIQDRIGAMSRHSCAPAIS